MLETDFHEAKSQLASILTRQLHDASMTFKTNLNQGRHTCKQGQIYNAFSLPGFRIDPEEAQRDCSKRHKKFGTADVLAGKRVLDLGSNIGGMLFEAQRFKPADCMGVEYDESKVMVSSRVAAFCDLTSVRFVQGDIDKISAHSVNGPYDVVMCLAVEAHVKKTKRLYRLLGVITREALYFEGNATSNIRDVEVELKANGFSRIENLGVCDDDSRPENNCRPLLRAFK